MQAGLFGELGERDAGTLHLAVYATSRRLACASPRWRIGRGMLHYPSDFRAGAGRGLVGAA
jgi:hypothetical protein